LAPGELDATLTLPRSVSFWLLVVLLVFVMCAASAPAPLYAVYQRMWGFPAITLTAAYGVFAFGGLGTLLTTGRLSDHLGRRLVLIVALLGEVAGMLAFIAATDVVTLFIGRIVTGLATGMALGAISAWIIDLQPNSGLGSLMGGVATLLGLGTGAFGSGLLVQFAPDPLHLVFWLLAGAYAIGALALLAVPDPVDRRPGWLQSLRPSIRVPQSARPTFVAGAPAIVGAFALSGLYLSLGPSLAIALLGTDNRAAGGLVVFALAGGGAVAAAILRSADGLRTLTRCSALIMFGVAVTLSGVWARSIALLYAGSLVAGIGLGPLYSAFLRTVVPLAPAEKRGALLSAIYVLVYLSFSIPAVLAGAGVTAFGLFDTTYVYGVAVFALAAVTTALVSRRLADGRASTPQADRR
jgi:MFS family permease